MNESESERYTAAMLTLGGAYAIVMAMSRDIPDELRQRHEPAIEWLSDRLELVMRLNERVMKLNGL